MFVFALIYAVWRLLKPSEILLPELPEIPPLLGRGISLIGSAVSALVSYFQNQATQASIATLQNQLDALWAAWADTTQAEILTDDHEAEQWVQSAERMKILGQGIYALGYNFNALWDRLRYTIMPATILNIYTVVWRNWIHPLRIGLVHTIEWAGAWHNYLEVFVINVQSYARAWAWSGRQWRRNWVYPQLQFLMAPWRVSYWYMQELTTGVVRYLGVIHHKQHRDAIGRVVFQGLNPLWQVFDTQLTRWLQTDVATRGWGSDPPKWPAEAHDAPPDAPPGVWEPLIGEPRELRQPPFTPRIPAVDYSNEGPR